MFDQYNRKIDYLRISVTDRCNFRCTYCMPEEGVESLRHADCLTFEEMTRVCKIVAKLGINKIKITGGEPLLRKNIENLIREIKKIDGIQKVTLTTNGSLLANFSDTKEKLTRAQLLKRIGIDGINISLDTLDKTKFKELTRRDELDNVMRGIEAAVVSGIDNIKINCVVSQRNIGEINEVARLAQKYPVHVRFIEMMPIGMGAKYEAIYKDDLMDILRTNLGELKPYSEKLGNGPAVYYEVADFQGKIGFITAVSHEFCNSCNRIRLTSDGLLKRCLNYDTDINLRDIMRQGVSDEILFENIKNAVFEKPKCHGFNQLEEAKREKRIMGSIGG